MDRRQFTNYLLAGGLLGWLGSVLYPLISYLKPPEVAEANVSSVKAGLAADFPNNSSQIVKFGRKPVILIRTEGEEVPGGEISGCRRPFEHGLLLAGVAGDGRDAHAVLRLEGEENPRGTGDGLREIVSPFRALRGREDLWRATRCRDGDESLPLVAVDDCPTENEMSIGMPGS